MREQNWVALKKYFDLRYSRADDKRIMLANYAPSFSIEEVNSRLPEGAYLLKPPIGNLHIWVSVRTGSLLIYEGGELRLFSYILQSDMVKDLERMRRNSEMGVAV